ELHRAVDARRRGLSPRHELRHAAGRGHVQPLRRALGPRFFPRPGAERPAVLHQRSVAAQGEAEGLAPTSAPLCYSACGAVSLVALDAFAGVAPFAVPARCVALAARAAARAAAASSSVFCSIASVITYARTACASAGVS